MELGVSHVVGNRRPGRPDVPLEREILRVAAFLHHSLDQLLSGVPASGQGPVALGQALGLDKVLASRVLKALRQVDSVAAMFFMPGPEPLRAVIKAAEKLAGRTRGHVAAEASRAVDEFARLIDVYVGDRSLLDSILSAWIPDARGEFELRRKQAAFKAMSQLKGVQADGVLATCILTPSDDPTLLDVVWVHGLTGLHRVRPGVAVKIASRRMTPPPRTHAGSADAGSGDALPRRSLSLEGVPIGVDAPPFVREFCSEQTPNVRVHCVKDSMFYILGDEGFGSGSSVDIVFAEVNRRELKVPHARRADEDGGEARGAFFFAETVVPAKTLQFDVLVHDSLLSGVEPSLRLYDTSFEGVADAMDPRRDLDRLDMLESIVALGRGLSGVRSTLLPRYTELLQRVMTSAGYDGTRMRAYRCAIDYPLYGSQVSMVFRM